MYHFESDYVNGCLPQVLEALVTTNGDHTVGYGMDPYCQRAAELIRRACQAPDALVSFLVGGTQTNMTVIATALKPWQGVLCPESGHINVHETGAIESTGHKVLPLPSQDGKITAEQIETAWTLYTLAELEAISSVCRDRNLTLYVDGARLGYALAAPSNDVTLPDLARLTDVFYIGGTKTGLLFGEAVVISDPALQTDFRYSVKQHGGMLAKGRLLGVQFGTVFQDGLYRNACQNAINCADRLHRTLKAAGIPLYAQSPTNQIFPILRKEQIERLREKYVFELWAHVDEQRDAVRFCTSWSTTEEEIAALTADLLAL